MRQVRSSESGFTIMQLMVVVTMIGILVAIAIPAYSRNVRKARSSEAAAELAKLHTASMTYIYEESRSKPASFPATQAATPDRSCCEYPGGKCPANVDQWDTATWEKLHFQMRDAHYFRYEYVSAGNTGEGGTATFTARALGDLDCNGSDEVTEVTGEYKSDVITTGVWVDPAAPSETAEEGGGSGDGTTTTTGNGNGNGNGNGK